MIRSMTGFAGAERQEDFGRLAWEVRSVNHRYLEIVFRLPEEFRALEPEFRQLIGKHVSRGKIDANLRYTPSVSAAGANLSLNASLVEQVLGVYRELEERSGLEQSPDLNTLARWPGMVQEQTPDPEPLRQAALELLAQAARTLQENRAREGVKMDAAIRERLSGIEEWVHTIRGWLPEIRDALKQKLLDRIGELKQPLETGRIEQEVAFLAQKIDVDEELDRLAAHVAESARVLDMDEPVGRRLDFLMQEFNRESNTLSSKSVDERTTKAAVELKVLIEQMREQVQNIE